MTSLVEQTARVLSGSRPSVQEKSLSDAEIEDLNVVMKLMKITAIRQAKWGWSVPGGEGTEGFSEE